MNELSSISLVNPSPDFLHKKFHHYVHIVYAPTACPLKIRILRYISHTFIYSWNVESFFSFLQSDGVSWSLWDGSVESFVSGASEVSRLIRECSVDSDCSDFSLDLPFSAGCSSNTLEVIERIEQEINSVKNNCLAMNHELYTLHDHPTSGGSEIDLSGMNMELAPLHLSQSSFKGMLNLTSISDEISDVASNASDFSPSHVQLPLISGR